MLQVERVSEFCKTLIYTVLERDLGIDPGNAHRIKVHFFAELEESIICLLMFAPLCEGARLQEQKEELGSEIVKTLANKYRDLARVANLTDDDLTDDCPLLQHAQYLYIKLKKPASPGCHTAAEATYCNGSDSDGGFGTDGDPLHPLHSVLKPISVYLPWRTWNDSVVTDAVRRRNQATSILSIAMGWFQMKSEHPIPLALVKRNAGPVTVIATGNPEPGHLHVPFFFRKHLSVYSDTDPLWYDPNAIRVTVRWTEDISDTNGNTHNCCVAVDLKGVP